MTEITLDATTQQEILSLASVAQEAQNKIKMICNIYVRSQGEEGSFELSNDASKLVKKEEADE